MGSFACKLKILLLACFFTIKAPAQTFKELADSMLYYYQAKDNAKAIPFAEKLVAYVKTSYGTDNKTYSTFLSTLGGLYTATMNLSKAETTFLELREVNRKVFGTKSPEYIKGLTLLAVIYNQTGRNSQTIPLLIETLEFYKHNAGDTSYDYGLTANRLAKVYEDMGEYEEALHYSRQASAIIANIKGRESDEYAMIINNQGVIYKNKGFPEMAEPLLLEAAAIRKKTGGENDPDYANSLNNLATLYTDLGQYQRALEYYEKAAAIYKKSHGESSYQYLTCLINVGASYDDLGNYIKAEEIYLSADVIAAAKYDESWPLRQELSHKLGQLYLSMEQFEKAEPLILKNVELEKNRNSNGADYALALNDLAYLYKYTDRKTEAEKYYVEAAETIRASMGDGHRDYAIALSNLALLFLEQKRYEEAIAAMRKVTKAELDQLLKLFAVLSASEKQVYIQRIEFMQNNNLSCLYNYPAASADFYIENFNTQLFLKSLLLTDNRNMVQSIRESNDTALITLFEKWQRNKKELTRQYALPEVNRSENLGEIEKETENDEKELVRRSAAFRDLRSGLRIRMEDLRYKLKADEAAIEFVHFKLAKEELTDSVIYAALVLRKTDSIPLFVPLFEEKQLAQVMGNKGGGSKAIVEHLYPGTQVSASSQKLYELVWKPIEKHLTGIKSIKFAPTGRLNQLAFHAISIDSSRLLVDKYELQQYLSTRDIVLADHPLKKPATALLFGDPDFSADSSGSGIGWAQLPGTAKEVTTIKKLFDFKKIKAEAIMRGAASEIAIKTLDGRSPQLLYFATHGFFLPESKLAGKTSTSYGRAVLVNAVNPLLRSGLVLAGGNKAWSGTIPSAGKEDGILTAYEVSNLDLGKTDLVVLSACETGLGDIKGTEGVFGLQRAFKLAGVKKLIVSLWKVPDKETGELMIILNKHWLEGKTIQASLAAARTEMQKKYSPYYWAAFVLVE